MAATATLAVAVPKLTVLAFEQVRAVSVHPAGTVSVTTYVPGATEAKAVVSLPVPPVVRMEND